MRKNILLLLLFILYGCDLIDYHPYDGKIKGTKDINATNIEIIEKLCSEKETIRFAMISDTQRWYDETKEVVGELNKRDDIDFVIHGGDISDFGFTKEFIWMRDILNKLTVPYVCIIGNHDCLGNGKEVFRTVFGKENFSFQAGNTRFICLNTNALEYDYSEPIPDFGFIEEEIRTPYPNWERTIVGMHAQPYNEQFNNNIARAFQLYIKQLPDLLFCIHGHAHQVTVEDIFDDGILYYQCANIKKKSYLVFTLTEEGYEYEAVYF